MFCWKAKLWLYIWHLIVSDRVLLAQRRIQILISLFQTSFQLCGISLHWRPPDLWPHLAFISLPSNLERSWEACWAQMHSLFIIFSCASDACSSSWIELIGTLKCHFIYSPRLVTGFWEHWPQFSVLGVNIMVIVYEKKKKCKMCCNS